MAKFKTRVLENIEITGIADKGFAVGRHEGVVVFVEGAVPGDWVDVWVYEKKKGHFRGKVEKLVTASPNRIAPFCEHFEFCGGCKWQNLAYSSQLEFKQLEVENALRRIGKVEPETWFPIIGNQSLQFFRNKLEYTASNRRWFTKEEMAKDTHNEHRNGLGFHLPGHFDKVLDIENCYLQQEPSNSIRLAIREHAINNDWTFYNVKLHEGMLRNVTIRTSSIGQNMVLISLGEDDADKRNALFEDLRSKFGENTIHTLCYVINTKMNDTIYDLEVVTYWGEGFIYEKIGSKQFKISPKSFFQTNTKQAEVLYNITADFAELNGNQNVYDLYTGTGSIGCYVADKCKHVVGIEEIEMAIADAKINAQLNNLENTTFYCGDVKDLLKPDFIKKHGKPDVLITDPPRAGMHEHVVNMLLEMEVPLLVYVSCNPATQARDLAILSAKYDVTKSQAVDMFPHTHHIENVVQLRLKK